MNNTITKILAECLERIEAGASLESCLDAYPEQAAELAPLLHMTQQMKSLAEIGPRQTFSQNARLRLENQLETPKKAVTFEQPNRLIGQKPKLLIQRKFSVIQFILAIVLALTATTGGVAYAAKASNPGDLLYGVDLAIEQVQLNLTPDVTGKLKLRIAFAQERLDEAQTTFSKNDTTDGLAAMNEYGKEISAIAQLIGSANETDKEALISLYEAAHSVREATLTKLLATVPSQAQGAIQNALDASNAPAAIPTGSSTETDDGRPSVTPAGPPTGVPNRVFAGSTSIAPTPAGHPGGNPNPSGGGNPNPGGGNPNPGGGGNPNPGGGGNPNPGGNGKP